MTNIIERVTTLHKKLIENSEYNQYLVATTDTDSVEGTLDHDTFVAAGMLRAAAKAAGDWPVASLTLTDIGFMLEQLIERPIDWERREADERASREARRALRRAEGLPDTPPPRQH